MWTKRVVHKTTPVIADRWKPSPPQPRSIIETCDSHAHNTKKENLGVCRSCVDHRRPIWPWLKEVGQESGAELHWEARVPKSPMDSHRSCDENEKDNKARLKNLSPKKSLLLVIHVRNTTKTQNKNIIYWFYKLERTTAPYSHRVRVKILLNLTIKRKTKKPYKKSQNTPWG